MKKILRKLFLNNFKSIFYMIQNSNSNYFDYNKIELVIKKDCCLGVKNTKIHGGGARDRKRKLLDKQKKGKARGKQFGKVEIPQEAFIGVLKINKDQ